MIDAARAQTEGLIYIETSNLYGGDKQIVYITITSHRLINETVSLNMYEKCLTLKYKAT